LDAESLAEAATPLVLEHLDRAGSIPPQARSTGREAEALAPIEQVTAALLNRLVSSRSGRREETVRSMLAELAAEKETFAGYLADLTARSHPGRGSTANTIQESGAVAGGGIEVLGGIGAAGRDFHVHGINVRVGNPPPMPAALVQLPPDIREFTGREHMVADLITQLQEAKSRSTPVIISVIAGKAGVGKTALAIHVAHRLGGAFPDGRLYVDLRGHDPEHAQRLAPADVLTGFLRDLGLEGAHIPNDVAERARLYRARLTGKQFLIVLDNASSVAQVRDLLPGSPGCAVLITSRVRLSALGGARHVNLGVLKPVEAVRLLGEIAGPERIAAEPDEAKEIASYCGYLPLALRIVGARLVERPYEPLSWLCDRLRNTPDRLDELEIGDLEVRASFRLSYEDLDQDAQRAFRLLGLLRIRSFPAWVVAALLGDTLRHAEKLADRLVQWQLLEHVGKDAAGQTRYRLHDLLRLFAQHLVSEEPEEVKQAALQRGRYGTLLLASQADAELQPGATRHMPEQQSDWPTSRFDLATIGVKDPLAWFTAERVSLVTVLERASTAEVWDFVWELTTALPAFFELRAHWTEWERTTQLALTAARRLNSRHRLAHSRRSLGDLRREQGRFTEAIKQLNACLPTFRKERDRPGEAAALRSLGNVYRQRFQWTEAHKYFAECLQIFQQLGDRRGAALSEHDLGIALRNQGQWDDAIESFQRCLLVFRNLKDQRSEAYVLRSLAVAYRNQGRWKEATDHIRQCLPIFDRIGDRRGWAYALTPLSDVFREQGDYESALTVLYICLLIREELGDRRWRAHTQRSIGVVHRLQGDPEAAKPILDNCLIDFRELGDDRLAAYTQTSLGEVYGDLGRREEALRSFEDSLEVLVALEDHLWEAKTQLSRGLLLSAGPRQQRMMAQADLRQALDIFTKLGAPEAKQARQALARLSN
jgi:tetratricopeptide (TPR) repeat protein